VPIAYLFIIDIIAELEYFLVDPWVNFEGGTANVCYLN